MGATFGEQIRVILKRKKMTIKELAEVIEKSTGMKMSRQNLTQRLARDNFQEQDMRMIVEVLGCSLELTVTDPNEAENRPIQIPVQKPEDETVDIQEALSQKLTLKEVVEQAEEAEARAREEEERRRAEIKEMEKERIREIVKRAVSASHSSAGSFIQDESEESDDKPTVTYRKSIPDPVIENSYGRNSRSGQDISLVQAAHQDAEAAAAMRNTADMGVVPDSFRRVSRGYESSPQINPHTGEEFESNMVRNHPKLKGYIQVYDRSEHKWIDMTEWAFLGFQERKKVMLGADYKPPIYLD